MRRHRTQDVMSLLRPRYSLDQVGHGGDNGNATRRQRRCYENALQSEAAKQRRSISIASAVHGAGFIAERSRVEGLPVRAEQREPSTRLLQSALARLHVQRACVAI